MASVISQYFLRHPHESNSVHTEFRLWEVELAGRLGEKGNKAPLKVFPLFSRC